METIDFKNARIKFTGQNRTYTIDQEGKHITTITGFYNDKTRQDEGIFKLNGTWYSMPVFAPYFGVGTYNIRINIAKTKIRNFILTPINKEK